jgi:deoxyxylulose-5-phosphate synthase
VKRGDLLSPLLFNLCLEPLLEAIEEQISGISINQNQEIPVLASADDIVLLNANEREAQHQVGALHEYLKGLNMTISGDKSQKRFSSRLSLKKTPGSSKIRALGSKARISLQ